MAVNLRNMVREQTEATDAAHATASHTAMQGYFLERLNRLSKKSILLSRYLVPTDRRMRLLNHAVLATYDDCRALEVAAEARAIIEEARRNAPAPLR